MIRSGSHHPSPEAGAPHAGRLTAVVLAALLPVVSVLVAAAPVDAVRGGGSGGGTPHKSYVCKYVGTPGVDERLQTGDNPIWVSNASLTGGADEPVEVGDVFSDAHGRSVVIVANTARLDPEPDVSRCPAPEGPVTVTATAPTATAPTCDADGALVVPEDTAAITYASTPTGTGPGDYTVTATAATGYVLDGTGSWSITVLPRLTGDQCLAAVTPVAPTVTPSTTCDVEGTYTVPATTGISYLLDGTAIAAGTHQGPASGTVTATALDGYRLGDTTWSYALSLPAAQTCAVEAPTQTTPTGTTPTEIPPTATAPTETAATTTLPKTGAPTAVLATAGALALLLGATLMAVGSRRPGRDQR